MAATPEPVPMSPLADRSLHAIVLGNLLTLALAYADQWSVMSLIWVYWWQSVVVGLFTLVRIARLRDFTTEGFKGPFQWQVPADEVGKLFAMALLTIHYGMFLFGLGLVFEAGWMRASPSPPEDGTGIAVATAFFVVAHGYSLLWNERRERGRVRPNLGTVMAEPYLRIVPMHLTVIAGAMVPGIALPLFVILKTVVDGYSHWITHAHARRAAAAEAVLAESAGAGEA